MNKLTGSKKTNAADSGTSDLLATTNLLGLLGTSEPDTTIGSITLVEDSIGTSAATDGDLQTDGTKSSAGRQTAPSAALAAVTLPAPSKPDLAASSDTGTSNTDDITRDTTPTLTGTAAARATVTIMDGATILGTAVATKAGKWTFTAGELGEGSHSLTATATDNAGNSSAPSLALAVTIDISPPAAPAALDLAAADDTGASGDDVTNRTSGLTVGGLGEAGAIVTLYDDTNNDGTKNTGEATLATATVNAAGAFSVDVALSAGIHHVRAFQTDRAGNVGGSSAALTVTVDTSAPTAPAGLDLAAEDDDGTSSSDDVTSNTLGLTVSGTGVNGSIVTLYDDANNDGTRNGGGSGAGDGGGECRCLQS